MIDIDMSGTPKMDANEQRKLLLMSREAPIRLINVGPELMACLELTRLDQIIEIDGLKRGEKPRRTGILWSEVIAAEPEETLHPAAFRWLRAGIVFAGITMLMLGIDALIGVI